ncbi:hypothetical protein FRB90_002573 [Tulasnella sp. 427]|nr:hypothetical protein FRB90_002573 [Tulasnella sp. 427]
MAPRISRSSTPKLSYTPANDATTHRDLLLFEERLKTNAAMLKRRKTRYQIFLLQLCAVIVIATCDFILDTYVLIWPINAAFAKVKPPYGPISPIRPHPYFAPGILLIAATTLFLFFSNGLYSEKIGYANKYVSHANRTLRQFNMYLNVRPRPITSSSWFLRILRSSPSPDFTSPPLSPVSPTSRSLPGFDLSPRARSPSSSRSAPITPIPPPTNPRGELIFNSRVDKNFRESYERYRALFEKAREDRQRDAVEAKRARSWWRWILPLSGWRRAGGVASRASTPAATSATGNPGDGVTPKRGRLTRTPSGSRTTTPIGSRKASPAGSLASANPRRRSANINSDLLLESVPERQPLEGELLRRTPTPSLASSSIPPSPITGPEDESDSATASAGDGTTTLVSTLSTCVRALDMMLLSLLTCFIYVSNVFGSHSERSLYQNGLDAQAMNAKFATMCVQDPCSAGEMACIQDGFAQCVHGSWQVVRCPDALICVALPALGSGQKPTLACTTHADASARFAETGVSGGIAGSNTTSISTSEPSSSAPSLLASSSTTTIETASSFLAAASPTVPSAAPDPTLLQAGEAAQAANRRFRKTSIRDFCTVYLTVTMAIGLSEPHVPSLESGALQSLLLQATARMSDVLPKATPVKGLRLPERQEESMVLTD